MKTRTKLLTQQWLTLRVTLINNCVQIILLLIKYSTIINLNESHERSAEKEFLLSNKFTHCSFVAPYESFTNSTATQK